MTDFLNIDGSHGEGGGQILRSTLSLSVIAGRRTGAHREPPREQEKAGAGSAASYFGAGGDNAL